jgi:hypothetical protein
MSTCAPRVVLFAACAAALGGSVFFLDACSSDPAEPPAEEASAEAGDTGLDRRSDSVVDVVQLVDAQCPVGTLGPQTGETCVGFGKGTPCDPECGIPAYGYVCFNGGPPSFTGCLQMTKTSLGETYCCPELRCVAQPDQDTMCASAAGTPHRYQCPPDEDGGTTAPPPGCVETGSGGSAVEHFFCCP